MTAEQPAQDVEPPGTRDLGTSVGVGIPRGGGRGAGRRGGGTFAISTLALPGALQVLIFGYLPMVGILVAFQDFSTSKGIFGSPFVGLDNFRFFFSSGAAPRVLFNTIFLNTIFITATTVASVGLAIAINEIHLRWFRRFAQSIVFVPYFLSWVVVSMMVQALLAGVALQDPLLNQWLAAFGIHGPTWFAQPAAWPWILMFVKVWSTAGYFSVIYLAAMTTIPDDLYEAARIDGASSAQLAARVTLPLLLPTIIVLTLLAIGRIFYGDFAMIYSLVRDNGLLYATTDVIDTYVFRSLRQLGDLGSVAAVGLFQSIFGLIVILIANAAARRISRDSALF